MSDSMPHLNPHEVDKVNHAPVDARPELTEAGGRFASPRAGELRRLAAVSAAREEARLKAGNAAEAPGAPPANEAGQRGDRTPIGAGRSVSGAPARPGGCGGGQSPRDPRREQHPLCLLCSWVERLAAHTRRQVEGGTTADVALLRAGMAVTGQLYAAVTGFLRSHLLGWCWGRRLTARRAICEACPYRRQLPYSGTYCGAERCDCPKAWWWPLGRLPYKQTLRAWRCPLGAWRLGPKVACEAFARMTSPGANRSN